MGSPGLIFFFFAILDGLACGSLGMADRSGNKVAGGG